MRNNYQATKSPQPLALPAQAKPILSDALSLLLLNIYRASGVHPGTRDRKLVHL